MADPRRTTGPLEPPTPDPAPLPPAPNAGGAAFTAAVALIAPAIKTITEAGMGGTEAGKLALEIFRETCCDGGYFHKAGTKTDHPY